MFVLQHDEHHQHDGGTGGEDGAQDPHGPHVHRAQVFVAHLDAVAQRLRDLLQWSDHEAQRQEQHEQLEHEDDPDAGQGDVGQLVEDLEGVEVHAAHQHHLRRRVGLGIIKDPGRRLVALGHGGWNAGGRQDHGAPSSSGHVAMVRVQHLFQKLAWHAVKVGFVREVVITSEHFEEAAAVAGRFGPLVLRISHVHSRVPRLLVQRVHHKERHGDLAIQHVSREHHAHKDSEAVHVRHREPADTGVVLVDPVGCWRRQELVGSLSPDGWLLQLHLRLADYSRTLQLEARRGVVGPRACHYAPGVEPLTEPRTSARKPLALLIGTGHDVATDV
eukprot:scaffold1596_cov302-Pinguiococcus_pyrenoidosus.AAC.56